MLPSFAVVPNTSPKASLKFESFNSLPASVEEIYPLFPFEASVMPSTNFQIPASFSVVVP